MGDYQDVGGKTAAKVDDPLGTRNDRALLERIEKDRIYQAGGAVRLTKTEARPSRVNFTRLGSPGTGLPDLVSYHFGVPSMQPR